MNLLIIGGTVFLGRHIVDYALSKGHSVTLFNRGKHNPDLFPDVEKIRGDRKTDFDKLRGREWDAVIDTCGYLPGDISKMGAVLKDAIGKYVFVSSISVYADFKTNNITEEYDLAGLPDNASPDEFSMENYGALKALCEKEVIKSFPEKYVNVRSGLIVGPNDPTDRFTYWVHRINSGGEVLAPGDGSSPVQFIDVRDLAGWLVRMVDDGACGDYNATGPQLPLTIHELLKECIKICDSDADLIWVDEKFIDENGIQPWTELPVWVPESNPEFKGFSKVNIDKALRQGLSFHSLSETIMATLSFLKELPHDYNFKAGLNSEQEKNLISKYKSNVYTSK